MKEECATDLTDWEILFYVSKEAMAASICILMMLSQYVKLTLQ